MENFSFCAAKVKNDSARKIKHDQRINIRKESNLREPLEIGESVLTLAERLNKKDAPGRFNKSTTESRPFLRNTKIYVVKKRTIINDVFYYWIIKKDFFENR